VCIPYIEISSNEGDLVLDPFMGSGTTAVACKMLKRNFIGFEINPLYCEIANQRLQKVE
jgi:DNA modification methylase